MTEFLQAAEKRCDHFYVSHCRGGMYVRICNLCDDVDFEDLAKQFADIVKKHHRVDHDTEPRVFYLYRRDDVTGVSGEGRVADGVTWRDGTVSMRWYGDDPSFINRDDIASVYKIHGHGGKTHVVFLDD